MSDRNDHLNLQRENIGASYREIDMSLYYRYVESIHSMRKPVITSEISPEFDDVPNTDLARETTI